MLDTTQQRGRQLGVWLMVGVLVITMIAWSGAAQAQSQDTIEINYATQTAGAAGPSPYTEDFRVTVANGETLEFGPDTSHQIRIKKPSTGESITLTPQEGESTTDISEFEINAGNLIEAVEADIAPKIGVTSPETGYTQLAVTLDGSVEMFQGDTFASYVVEVTDENETTLSATEPQTHGVRYEAEGEYNGSALAVPKDPGVQDDWHVELAQDGEALAEIDPAAHDDWFVIPTENIGFNESETFDINFYKSNSSGSKERLITLFYIGGPENAFSMSTVDGSVGTDSSNQSDSVTLSLRPAEQSVSVGTTATYDILIENADNGVASYEFDLATSNTTVGTIEQFSPAGTTADNQFTTVDIASDGSTAGVSTGVADIEDEGSVVLGTIDVNASAPGSMNLSISDAAVGDVDANSYNLSSVSGGDLTVTDAPDAPTVVDSPAQDLDDDGRLEDVNGNGEFDIVDVNAFFQNRNSEAVVSNADQFNFNNQGGVDIVDVNSLFQEYLATQS